MFPLLTTLDAALRPEQCTVCLAGFDGEHDPLERYLAGDFDAWLSRQCEPALERPLLVSLIALPEPGRWLFAGVYRVGELKWDAAEGVHRYDVARHAPTEELEGRLVLQYEVAEAQARLCGERAAETFAVAGIHQEKVQLAEFPGYDRVLLAKPHLDVVVRHEIVSWKDALSAVAGIYLIADRHSGKLYVGSAGGPEGIWGRWKEYALSGHGDIGEIEALLEREGNDYAANLHFGILETADLNLGADTLRERESHWKGLLLTRVHGYNGH